MAGTLLPWWQEKFVSQQSNKFADFRRLLASTSTRQRANCGRADESTLSMSQSTSNKMTHQKILRSSHSGNCPLQTPPTRPSVVCCLVAITRPRVVTHLPTMMRLWLLQETPAAELLRRNVRFPPFLLLLTLKNSRWKLLCCCYLHVV